MLAGPLRELLGISGPTELDVVARDGVLELSVADLDARVEDRGGVPVIVTDCTVAPLTVDDVRDAIARTSPAPRFRHVS